MADRNNESAGLGIWVLICGDLVAFGFLFCVSALYRDLDPSGFAAGEARLNVPLGVFNTLLLLTGSWCVVHGVSRARDGDGRSQARWFLAAIACGALFLGDEVVEYARLIRHPGWLSEGWFFSFFFVMTGIHLIHVLLALAALGYGVATAGRSPHVAEAVGLFWHLVDMLWLLMFPLLYLVGNSAG